MAKNPTSFLGEEYKELRDSGLEWRVRILQSSSIPRSIVDGKEVIMLCSNNYLGLSDHPKLKQAAIGAVQKYGAGSGSVRPIAGTMDLHIKLEKKIAEFKKTEAALYYQSGFTANSGAIPALMASAQKGLIISDELNHGSIIDGVRLTKAERQIYPHKNTEELAKLLEAADKGGYDRILVITDGVFSMDGDIAPLDKIAKLAHEHGAMTYVDDAHGDGVLGKKGTGIVEHFSLHGKIDVEMGTFSKAFGTVGGYICGSEDLCKFALNKSRTWLLTGSHPPAVVAASIAALEVIESEPQIHKKLWDNTKYYKGQLQKLGFDTGVSETPITPVMLGESKLAQTFADELFKNGVFGLPIVFPMVAKDKARIRTMCTAAHEKKDIDEALSVFEKVGKKLSVI